jgi:hypothetical protein
MTTTADREALLAEEKKLRRWAERWTSQLRCSGRSISRSKKPRRRRSRQAHGAATLPDKEDTFDLIYGARLRRVLVEKYRLQ